MQTVYALVMCAVLNNQVQWDRCQLAPGYGDHYFASSQQCWNARTAFALTAAGIIPALSADHRFIQWKLPNSGPFNTTATCVQKDAPMFKPAP